MLVQPSLATPTTSDDVLAKGCYNLIGSDLLADMEFVVYEDCQDVGGATPNSGSEGLVGVATSRSEDGEGVVIKAHRVIVASRCEWMKRALMSGMREAIDR